MKKIFQFSIHPSSFIIHPLLLVSLVLIILFALTGSSDAVDIRNIQDDAATVPGDLTTTSVGQTFVSHVPRLHAIQVLWSTSDDFAISPAGRVVLHLRHRPEDLVDLATASVSPSEIQNNQFSKFVFAPLSDSRDVSYYFYLDASQVTVTQGTFTVWASAEDNYASGQLLVNGTPEPRDLVFRTFCEPDLLDVVLALARTLTRFASIIPSALLLLIIPGLALVPWSRPQEHLELVALVGAVSLALLSAVSVIQLGWAVPTGILVAGAAPVLLIVRILADLRRYPGRPDWLPKATTEKDAASSLSLLALTLLSVTLGFVQVRDLPVPLWVDSLSHAGTIDGLLAQARLPGAFLYHQGYDAIVALLVQLSGGTMPDAMLLLGQLLMTQAGLSLFLLVRRLSGSTLAGLAAAVVIWFLSPTPVYFITWGRYPLLLGVAILPIALLFGIDAISRPRFHPASLLLAALTLAGLAFAHVRLVAFYGAFLVVYALIAGRTRAHWVRLLALALPVSLFALLWLGLLFSRGASWQSILATNAAAPEIDLSTVYQIQLSHHGPAVILLAVLSAAAGVWRRSHVTLVVLAWYAFLLFMALLPPVLPGSTLLSPAFVLLLGFFPAALLISDGVVSLVRRLDACGTPTVRAWAGIAFALVVLLGARDMVSIANPATVLYSDADSQAMQWIRAETLPQSRILVNSFVWFGAVVMPAGGGGWIPYETGRAIDYVIPPASLDSWVQANGPDFIYLGWRAGILRRSQFLLRPDLYTPVYDRDAILIFRVNLPPK